MKLSTYFTDDECRCKGENCCDGTCVMNHDYLLKMDIIRAELGAPLIVHSGFRCNRHNSEIGGVPSSYHRLGEALDVHCVGVSLERVAEIARKYMREVIVYDTFVHIAKMK